MHNEKNQNCINKLQKALDCMLLVLNNVNDNMHQIGITGFHVSYNIYFENEIYKENVIWSLLG